MSRHAAGNPRVAGLRTGAALARAIWVGRLWQAACITLADQMAFLKAQLPMKIRLFG